MSVEWSTQTCVKCAGHGQVCAADGFAACHFCAGTGVTGIEVKKCCESGHGHGHG